MHKNTEAIVQRQVCDYLRYQYRGTIFRSDQAGVNQTSRYARGISTVLQSHRGYPDLFVAEPRGEFHGLYLELKADGVRVWLKNGTLTTDKHIREQADVLVKLRIKGYAAYFARGFDEAKAIIDWFMAGGTGKLDLQQGVLTTSLQVSNSDEGSAF